MCKDKWVDSRQNQQMFIAGFEKGCVTPHHTQLMEPRGPASRHIDFCPTQVRWTIMKRNQEVGGLESSDSYQVI